MKKTDIPPIEVYENENQHSEVLDESYNDPSNRWWETTDLESQPEFISAKKTGPVIVNSDDGRPELQLHAGIIHELATTSEHLMIRGGTPFYVRGGTLLQPVIEYGNASDGSVIPVPSLKQVSNVSIIDYMSRHISFQKFDARAKKLVKKDPPSDIAAIIASRQGEWAFPPISGLISCPTIRRDGSIIWKSGYDPQTRLFLVDPPKLPSVAEHPTRDDALSAAKKLESLLDEFPFVTEPDKPSPSLSVALSGLITPVVRGALAVAPMHVMSATGPSSGKSFLVNLCAVMVTGNKAPVMTASKNVEEMDKSLAAKLMASESIISIDNVNGQLYSDLLCQAIEQPIISVRILGQSRMVNIESKSTLYATGNQISVADDMTRRVVLCKLDPNVERPEERQFEHSPMTELLKNRGEYISAAITIVRAYILAGRPDRLPPIASFEDWSNSVRSALVWLGYADPCVSMKTARDDDQSLASIRAFVAAWNSSFGINSVFSSHMAEHALTPDGTDFQIALNEFCPSRSGPVTGHALGFKLKKIEGKIIDGYKINSEIDAHKKIKKWFLTEHLPEPEKPPKKPDPIDYSEIEF